MKRTLLEAPTLLISVRAKPRAISELQEITFGKSPIKLPKTYVGRVGKWLGGP